MLNTMAHNDHPQTPRPPRIRPQLEVITNTDYHDAAGESIPPAVAPPETAPPTPETAAHTPLAPTPHETGNPPATNVLPAHVRDSFHVDSSPAKRLGPAWDYGWQVKNVVLIQVTHPDRAAWSSRLRETLKVEGVRIVSPIRTTDGRFINAGWRASNFVAGELARRADETIAAALRLDAALAQVPIPDSFHVIDYQDVFSVADHAAWSENHDVVVLDTTDPTHETVVKFMPKVREWMRPLVDAQGKALPKQVTHADMFATTLYAGEQVPTVTDIVGVVHPYGYTAALAVVDALLMDAVDIGVIDRFRHVVALEQLILRALLYRLYVHALHPDTSSNTGTNLGLVCADVESYMSKRHGTI